MVALWAELQSDILDLILHRLPLEDFYTVGKVCTSWQSVFLDRRRLTNPPPCLLLVPARTNFNSEDRPRLSSLHGDQFLLLCSPNPDLLWSEVIIGSSMGWLVIATYPLLYVSLLNPISNQRIPLPTKTSDGKHVSLKWDEQRTCFVVDNVVLSSVPTSEDCVLIARGLYEDRCFRLAWCRPGGQEWTIFTKLSQSAPEHMMFHKGELYVLAGNRDIIVYVFDSQLKMTEGRFISPISIDISYSSRFVELGGELYLISRCNRDGFEVFKQVEKQEGEWVKVNNLGDRVLLVGHRGVKSYCTKNWMGSGFEANYIYSLYSKFDMSTHCVVKFSMANKRNRKYPLPLEGYIPKEWITPQEW